ncbi:hypothetical protein [Streptomyces sp. NPDC097610]|uniref:hypothetical protein n=1 Tax=Streptomyces sp. NPDC097610 TaxID=3157227 RepID=UPI0033187EBC
MLVGLLGVALGLVGEVLGGLCLGGGVLGVGVGDGLLLVGDRLGVLSGQDDEAGGGVGVGVGGAELDGVVGRVGDLFGRLAGVDGGLGGDVGVAGGLRRGRECLGRLRVGGVRLRQCLADCACWKPEELPSLQVTRHFFVSRNVIHKASVGGSRFRRSKVSVVLTPRVRGGRDAAAVLQQVDCWGSASMEAEPQRWTLIRWRCGFASSSPGQ